MHERSKERDVEKFSKDIECIHLLYRVAKRDSHNRWATVDICVYLVTTILHNLGRAMYTSCAMSSHS